MIQFRYALNLDVLRTAHTHTEHGRPHLCITIGRFHFVFRSMHRGYV